MSGCHLCRPQIFFFFFVGKAKKKKNVEIKP